MPILFRHGDCVDQTAVDAAWEKQEAKLREEDTSAEEIAFQKKNFMLLDAQRYFIENSFDFIVQSIGIYDNTEIVKMACIVLQHKFVDLTEAIDADTIPITVSETTMENCFDITLENEDYTVGEILNYIIYETNFVKNKVITFCGFKKLHPHDSYSILRIAFVIGTSKMEVRQCIRSACVEAQYVYKRLFVMF
jgi:DNA-directed RNA polymerase subunit L